MLAHERVNTLNPRKVDYILTRIGIRFDRLLIAAALMPLGPAGMALHFQQRDSSVDYKDAQGRRKQAMFEAFLGALVVTAAVLLAVICCKLRSN